jgi:hypothetical protein
MPLSKNNPHIDGLLQKQRDFVRLYVETKSAAEAARLAGYSKKTAPVIGGQNLKKPQIAAAIKHEFEELEKNAGVTIGWTLEKVKEFLADPNYGPDHAKLLELLLRHFRDMRDLDIKANANRPQEGNAAPHVLAVPAQAESVNHWVGKYGTTSGEAGHA